MGELEKILSKFDKLEGMVSQLCDRIDSMEDYMHKVVDELMQDIDYHLDQSNYD